MTIPTNGGAQSPNLDNQRLSAQLELKNRALAATDEGITIADLSLPDNPLIYVNAGFERLTGYSAAEVIGRNCRFLQGPGGNPQTVDILRSAVRERRAVTVQLLNYRKNGAPFWNRLSITPVSDATGVVTHFIGVQSDVTVEREATDALREANERLRAASEAMRLNLQAAEAVQRSLLPAQLPHVPGMNFAFKFRPCHDVGGDCLNILRLDDRHLGVYILDVSGHGVAAALLSVTLSHMLSVIPDRSFLYRASGDCPGGYRISSPVEVVTRLNQHFLQNPGPLQYFTMIYGILDQVTAKFRYVSAGHLSPIHFPYGHAPRIRETGGIPAGLLSQAKYEEHTIVLSPGDRLYLGTDGIMEAESASGDEYGLDRMLATLGQCSALPLAESLTVLMDAIEEWSVPVGPADDASMLIIERCA